jgi:hypothetical protein
LVELLAETARNDPSSHISDAQDSPPQSCGVTFKRDCAEKNGCIVAAITNQVRQSLPF